MFRSIVDFPRTAAVTVAVLVSLGVARDAAANICNPQSSETNRAAIEVPLMEHEDFAKPATEDGETYDWKGDPSYNIMILACNRKRDTLANNLEKAAAPDKTFGQDLPIKTVRGHYRFLSYPPGLRYGYQIRREKGTWKVTIPTDLQMPKSRMTDMLDIPEELSTELGLDGAGKSCDPKGTKFRDGDSTKEVLSGFIAQKFDGDPSKRNGARYAAACRVKRSLSATTSWSHGKQTMPTLLKRWWQKKIKDVWSRPGFEVEPILVDLDKPSAAQLDAWEKDELVWHPQLNMITFHRPTYKRWAFKFWSQIYSGVPTNVFAHEFAHNMGLDDEYNELGDSNECEAYINRGYIMCKTKGFTEARNGAKGLYAWIATRRYAIAEEPQCKQNSDCGTGSFCAKHGLGRNVCEDLRGPCDACSADDQCGDGTACIGKPIGHCAKRSSADVGDGCCANDQCKSGNCSADQLCQCTQDSQCLPGSFCAEPLFSANTCVPKMAECDPCSNDGECKSGQCKLGKCVTPSTLAVGASCCRDDQCRSGSCNAKGTCQCKHDSDCAAGRYCADHGLNANTCDATKAICATCGNDSQCGSPATCKGLIGFQKCIVENALGMGATCCMDAQCKTNRCEKDRCVCHEDSDCPRGQKCKTPITGQNHCE